jgi:hypothetical protein
MKEKETANTTACIIKDNYAITCWKLTAKKLETEDKNRGKML